MIVGMKSLDAVRDACARAQGMTARKARIQEVLNPLRDGGGNGVRGGHRFHSVIDEEGLLRNGASPNLPRDYLNAIDRLKPDAGLGTCAAAAATGMMVVTPSFLADDKWAELRHLPLALGFAGAWSMPIKSEDGTVLGDLRHLVQGRAGESTI